MIDAPAKEIAIGRKISDFATASPRRSRSASVANNKPMLTAANGTTMIHNAVFLIDLSMLLSLKTNRKLSSPMKLFDRASLSEVKIVLKTG